ncbi:hypothetical protein ALI22I_09505 [Saccharothrix sp. ALI-22-I]|uniref:hypothetical protein n=1 Tax=Saccharothrix sp. ALI-22-I TaxID=1933778 RepID=UPI00097BF985|nr:hypothetical protein [Saccharothrix sp. ALI-22-I]ONI91291.1 hypothetical protein ALI22I_09505 [Saccharothrix sp. ALI-22-I]
MTGTDAIVRRLRVTVAVVVEVTDPVALERAALRHIDEVDYCVDDIGPSVDEVRAEERDRVRGDVEGALLELVDPYLMVDVEGVEFSGSECEAVEVDEHDRPVPSWPDFATLFPVCGCDMPDCDDCASDHVTPRTAAVLWGMAGLLADHAYDDVIEHGDDPVEPDDPMWSVFDEFPRITWLQDAIWRRRAARAFDDLAADLLAGRWPQPTCPAEEMALHLMLRYGEELADDGTSGLDTHFAHLPVYDNDLQWTLLADVLFKDHDILELFDPGRDGIEDPDDEQNRSIGMGDYTPPAWFTTFDHMTPRDPRRPFRR